MCLKWFRYNIDTWASLWERFSQFTAAMDLDTDLTLHQVYHKISCVTSLWVFDNTGAKGEGGLFTPTTLDFLFQRVLLLTNFVYLSLVISSTLHIWFTGQFTITTTSDLAKMREREREVMFFLKTITIFNLFLILEKEQISIILSFYKETSIFKNTKSPKAIGIFRSRQCNANYL